MEMFSITVKITEEECEAAFMNSSINLDFNLTVYLFIITLLVLGDSFTSLAKNFFVFLCLVLVLFCTFC